MTFHFYDIQPNWMPEPEIRFMCAMCLANNFQNILEIGCWVGRSTVHLAQIGSVTVIDTFKGSDEPAHEAFLKGRPEGYLLECLKYNLEINILRATILVGTSSEMLTSLNQQGKKFNAILIDGSHKYEDVKSDISKSLELLDQHGVIFIDDCNWPDIAKAVSESPIADKIKMFDPKLGYYVR